MAQAQAPSKPSEASETTEASPSEFVKVEGGGPERTSAEGTVYTAYLLMLGIMVVFVWRTFRAQYALLSEVSRLSDAVNKGTNHAGR